MTFLDKTKGMYEYRNISSIGTENQKDKMYFLEEILPIKYCDSVILVEIYR